MEVIKLVDKHLTNLLDHIKPKKHYRVYYWTDSTDVFYYSVRTKSQLWDKIEVDFPMCPQSYMVIKELTIEEMFLCKLSD